jgi:hypothetical protein
MSPRVFRSVRPDPGSKAAAATHGPGRGTTQMHVRLTGQGLTSGCGRMRRLCATAPIEAPPVPAALTALSRGTWDAARRGRRARRRPPRAEPLDRAPNCHAADCAPDAARGRVALVFSCGRLARTTRAYSSRRVMTGSTRAARRAGSHAASTAPAETTATTPRNVPGSCGVVWNRNVAIRRVA